MPEVDMTVELRTKGNQANSIVISPDKFQAVLFDMDGVVTRTAKVHFFAWKTTFDAYLRQKNGDKFQPFTKDDYLAYVDGMPREDGVRSFLESRHIKLPEGGLEDPSGFGSISALGRKKNEEFLRQIRTQGVEPYETTISLIRSLRSVGIAIALVTASKNGAEILQVAHITHLFDAIVTGVEAEKLHIHGKPAPDVFLEAARKVSVTADRAIVVEDAEAGVESGRNGHFGMVIGVARQGDIETLKQHGATVVVRDLAEVSVQQPQQSDSDIQGMAMADLGVTEANWIVSYNKYDPSQEGKRESLCALGNGKFCTRGAAAEAHADGVHYPGTYFGGAYNSTQLQVDGASFEMEELVNMPNWLCLTFKIDNGDWFSLDNVEILEFSQKLNLREGILYRDVQFRDRHKRITTLSERRFVHMRYSHLAGVETVITPIDWSGYITVRSALDGRIVNSGNQLGPSFTASKHLQTLECTANEDTLFLKVMTNESKVVVAEAARTEIRQNGQRLSPKRENVIEEDFIGQEIILELKQSQSIQVQKTVSLYTSRDRGIYEPGFAAKETVNEAPEFDNLITAQMAAWRSLWRQYDLFIETKEEYSKLVPSLLVHLNSFHCIQTASPHTVDLDNSVPARGWTGEGYEGHIFWDDLFVFPFINFRMPNVSAALLKYRYRRLSEARKIATSYGANGACFPWQSASDGKERTPHYWWMPENQKWIRDYTHLELHVNGAIAYNIWQYYQVTTDNSFMYSYGSEILLEIARFFATYAKLNIQRDRYEIKNVIGPDEFHNGYPNCQKPGINNNAYTNILAVWTLCRALELLEILPPDHREHVRTRFDITDTEIKHWEDVSRKMFIPIMKNGVIEQFESYENLDEFPGSNDGKIDHDQLKLALKENFGYLKQYKISKQADALMLGFLFSQSELNELVERLGYANDCVALDRMADFYIPRTANESTLSRIPHIWILSRLERRLAAKLLNSSRCCKRVEGEDASDAIFYEALGSDYFDVAARGTTNTGVHMGAMSGTVDIVQRCYTGIVTRGDVLWLDPMLPKPLVRLSFTLRYRGQLLYFDMNHDKINIHAGHSSTTSIRIGYGVRIYELRSGDTQVIALAPRA
jgi:beta-phosphoglucomutase family hydrolase